MNTTNKIPARKDISAQDTWDLSALFSSDEAWRAGLASYKTMSAQIDDFRGTLSQSAERLAQWLAFCTEFGILEERLGYYCELRQNEDEGSDSARAMVGSFMMVVTEIAGRMAWATPEIQAISDERMSEFLQSACLKDYSIYLAKLLRWKPHILSDKEERILAMQAEVADTAHDAFSVLTNVDFDFGELDTPEGPKPLSQSSLSSFLESPNRDLREQAYKRFYGVFNQHRNTLASLYSSSVKRDVYSARVRGFNSSREQALFPDKVSTSVYDHLVAAVNARLPALQRYYALRKKVLRVAELRHWDVMVPLVRDVKRHTSWDEAVDIISQALAPLGDEYVSTLRAGLSGRWADRYENKGKRSGAFSAGSYTGEPYILMNYKEDIIRDVFTLAHEAGHSMHSWYSARSNHFLQYNYTIFEAEVASTFNEELLFRHLMATTDSREMKAYLVNKRLDDILATLFRQTMFAEFEDSSHRMHESGQPLTLDALREVYGALQRKYFGPEMVFEEESNLECLRIPHFYRAFYVYKYATGISAALSLADRVLSGGAQEREDWFSFLKSGGSRYPLESLKLAGVDMSTDHAVNAACDTFEKLCAQLESLLDI